MNDYNDLIEMLRDMSRAIIRDNSIALGIAEELITDCDANACNDAANAIEWLVRDNEILTEERDAAIAELKMLEKHIGKSIPKRCKTCELWGKRGWSQFEVGYCEGDDNPHSPNDFCSRWRGV